MRLDRSIKNIVASVDQRLLNLARADGRSLDDVRDRYVRERFLYRLSLSPHREDYLVKGATVLQSLAEPTYRTTKDVDLQGLPGVDPQVVLEHLRDVLGQDTSTPPDGLRFDQDSIRIEPLRPEAGHRLHRLTLVAKLGKSQYVLRMDIGYGDRPTPPPVERTLSSLLDHPGPVVLCCRLETSLAEKFHAVVDFDIGNTRMKDYYDFWYVAGRLPVSGHDLAAALTATFRNQGTPLRSALPVGLTDRFAQEKQADWSRFRAKLKGGERGPAHFPGLVKDVRAFLMPVVRVAETDPEFRGHWDADRGRWTAEPFGERDDVPAPRETADRPPKGAW